MLPLALALIVAAFAAYGLARGRPRLQPLAVGLFAFGAVLAVVSAVRSLNPVERATREYHNMHHRRQALQAEMLARTLRQDDPPARAVYLHNRLFTFSDTHLEALREGAGDAFRVDPCHGGSRDLDPEVNISGYTMDAGDVRAALEEFPDADFLVFEGVPPAGTFELDLFQTRKPRWAMLSAPPGAELDRWFEMGMVAACEERPVEERASASQGGIPRGLEKGFAAEYVLRTKE